MGEKEGWVGRETEWGPERETDRLANRETVAESQNCPVSGPSLDLTRGLHSIFRATTLPYQKCWQIPTLFLGDASTSLIRSIKLKAATEQAISAAAGWAATLDNDL